MSDSTSRLSGYAPYALALLRVIAGLLFMEHGTSKWFALPHNEMFDNLQLLSIFGIGGIIELVGGLLIILGAFTRPVAFILSGEMAVAYFMFHAPQSVFPAANNGDAAILFCFIFFYLIFAGPGPFSVDGARRGR